MQKIHVDSILDTKALKTVNNPGPGEHNLDYNWSLPKDTLGHKTGPQFSFSKSTTLQRDHFEKQLKKGSSSPAPGQYGGTLDVANFQSVTSRNKRGGSVRYSILENPDKLLNQTQTSVGFSSIHSSTIIANKMNGFRNTNMEKIGKSLASTIRTDRGNSFGLANDRFMAPTQKKQSPSPQAYNISDSIGYNDESR